LFILLVFFNHSIGKVGEKTLATYRYALIVEYDGSHFSGWQRQDNISSVQGCLEDALLCLTRERASIQGAGRTDAGVHALGQVAHCNLSTCWPLFKLRQGMNFYLRDKGVVVVNVYAVDDTFHARFSAQERSYQYTIVNRSSPPLFAWGTSWWIPRPLCVDAMQDACAFLCGTHDFSRFRHRDCQSASPIKTLSAFYLHKQDDVLTIHARALSFLHRQVRLLVGALVQVGKGN
jgi:tRNA pseudouridine38-40 synthase